MLVFLQVPSDVLYVWLSVPGLHHPGHHLLWGHHPALLLPSVRWGEDWQQCCAPTCGSPPSLASASSSLSAVSWWLCALQAAQRFGSQCFSTHCLSPPQDYHWQWRAFLTSGFTAVYFVVYAVHYFFSKLQITGLASTILYYGYTLIMALIFFLFSGECQQELRSIVHHVTAK